MLDQMIFDWFLDARLLKFPVSGSIIQQKAKDIRDELLEDEDVKKDQVAFKKLKDMARPF